MWSHALSFVFTLAISFLVFANGMPQGGNNNNQEPQGLFGLPFIQLTNGGIRFNFAGYHAEAGLGGLLDGSRAGGGLHASAGTPWGASAAAGLGGTLGGNDGTAGGGLYARAGLGNGMPEASAGLGGMLDGSGRSNVPASGGLYAGASTGRRHVPPENGGANAGANVGATAGSTASGSNDNAGRTPGRSNIQIISRSDKKTGKIKEVVEASERGVPQDPPAEKGIREVHRESIGPAAGAGASLYGAVVIDPNTGIPSVSKSAEKVKVLGGTTIREAPAAQPLSNVANEVLQDNRLNRDRPAYPRWFRKRLTKAQRKQLIVDHALEVKAGSVENTPRIRRQSGREPVETPETGRTIVTERERNTPNNQNNRYFDNIFNIPISTLTAVNQLLRNNSS